MEFQDVVRRRRMVRRFGPDAVPEASLQQIMDNAVRGPSAGFSQGQAFLVLRGAELDAFWQIGSAVVNDDVQTAPLVVVPMSSKQVYLDR